MARDFHDLQGGRNTPGPTTQTGMTFADLVSYTRRVLGPGGRAVEISDAEIEDAIRDSLDLWSESLGRHLHWRIICTCSHKTVYTLDEMHLPPDVTTDQIMAIVDVQDARIGTTDLGNPIGGPVNPDQMFFEGYAFAGYGGAMYPGEYDVMKRHQHMVRDMTNFGFEWRWEPGERVLVVDNVQAGIILGVTGVKAYELKDMPRYYQRHFKQTVEAFGRIRLGDARGKYGGQIPGSTQGQTVDADYQRQKGEAMLTEIRQWLAQAEQTAPPTVG